ncbi:MAG: nitrous oxide reductase accessory protein NosL [Sneathiella sp.]
MTFFKIISLFFFVGLLAGCNGKDVDVPSPVALTDEAVGNYCGMDLVGHPGPKAQVFEKGRAKPIWFSAVRDALAYSRLPGEAQSISALYVHDMGRATSWENPQDDGIWIPAQTAFFVVGSEKRGGMGMIEIVPFGGQEKAQQFALQYGGSVVPYAEVSTKYIFPDLDEDENTTAEQPPKGTVQ